MSRRSIILCTAVVLLLLGGIGWFFWSLFFRDGGEPVMTDRLTDGVEAVPSDAIFLMEAASLSEIAAVTDGGSALGRLLGCIPSVASGWKAALSMHYSSKNAVSPLLVLSVPPDEDPEGLMFRILDGCGGVVDKRYGAVTVHKAAVPDASFAVYGHFLIASPSLVIVETSLRHLESGTSVKDESLYNEISGVTSGRGVLHVNFSNLGKLFSGAAGPEYVRYARFFQSFADWGAFGLRDGDSPRTFDGKVVGVRSGECFRDVLLSQRGRKPEVWSVAPYSVSYVLSVPMTSCTDYLRAYQVFRAAGGWKNGDSVSAALAVSLDLKEAAVFALDADGGRKILALRCGNVQAMGEVSGPVNDFTHKGCFSALLGDVFAPSAEDSWCVMEDWVLIGGREEITSLQRSWAAGTYFPLSDYLAQTPASEELREISSLTLMINAGRYADVLSGYFKEPYSEYVRKSLGGHNFEMIFLNTYGAGGDLRVRVSLYGEDLTELPQPSGDGDGTAPELVEDVPVTVPRGPFPVKNFIDGSTNWLEQLENNDIRLLGASRNPLWTVKFQTPLCGTVRQIDYLKNDKLQMLFASEDKIYLLDRLGRKVGRFPISLGKRILLGPDVYDFSGDRDYTLMVLHEDNTLMQYGLDGKPVPGWNVISLNEKIMSLPERIVVGGRTYWAVRTSYQTLLYDAHGTICADFSKKNKLRKDTEIETVSSHEAGVTMADGRAMILNLSDGSFRKR